VKKRYSYKKEVPVAEWNRHLKGESLESFVELIGWEALDNAMQNAPHIKKVTDVSIDITPSYQDSPSFREVVVTVEYETIV